MSPGFIGGDEAQQPTGYGQEFAGRARLRSKHPLLDKLKLGLEELIGVSTETQTTGGADIAAEEEQIAVVSHSYPNHSTVSSIRLALFANSGFWDFESQQDVNANVF